MTCREFMAAAELLTPVQLLRIQAEEPPLSVHAQECAACGRWLESHRVLGNALHTLRTANEHCEAGPAVEEAVLQAFRTQGFTPRIEVTPKRPVRAMWQLSRLFEVGAYAAVAAALIVGVFLTARVWRDRQAPSSQRQSLSVPAKVATPPAAPESAEAVQPAVVSGTTALRAQTANLQSTRSQTKPLKPVAASRQAGSVDQAGYMAVMLCDPLICSGDEQVIRMELPAGTAGGSGSQPVMADVVIGEDGLVRAMRIVNE